MGAVISSSSEEENEEDEVFSEEEEKVEIRYEENLKEIKTVESESDSDISFDSSSDSSSSDDSSFFGDSTEEDSETSSYEEVENEIFEGILFSMGNPLLDLSTNVAEGFLKKYNLKTNDAIIAEEKHLPMYKDLVDFFPIEYIAGGATQNSVKVCQWMLGVPQATTFIGCIGNDEFGQILKQKAEDVGVKTAYYVQDKEPTGTCAALICGHDRSLCANLAAANEYKKEHLDQKENWALVEKAKFYYIAGFFLTVSVDSILAVAKHAAENGKIFMMNLSAPFLCEFFKDQQTSVLPYADILFGNETEAAVFSKIHNFGTEDVAEIAKKLAGWTKINSTRQRIVVITQGAEPAIVATGPHEVAKYPIIKIKPEDIVDTNGAGDAFVGGFLSQLVKGKSIEQCVQGGHYAANLIIQRSGCTFPKEKCTFES
uniref:adenosine kinase 2-like isoform X1 n=1 Tax=Styela clava TaxID=7725 RepID=UPI001939B018|nr:adenosine kinase 2-like isoform X1 [Styela clava]